MDALGKFGEHSRSYQANWELVTLWVRNIPVDSEDTSEYMKDHMCFSRRERYEDMITHRSIPQLLSCEI